MVVRAPQVTGHKVHEELHGEVCVRGAALQAGDEQELLALWTAWGEVGMGRVCVRIVGQEWRNPPAGCPPRTRVLRAGKAGLGRDTGEMHSLDPELAAREHHALSRHHDAGHEVGGVNVVAHEAQPPALVLQNQLVVVVCVVCLRGHGANVALQRGASGSGGLANVEALGLPPRDSTSALRWSPQARPSRRQMRTSAAYSSRMLGLSRISLYSVPTTAQCSPSAMSIILVASRSSFSAARRVSAEMGRVGATNPLAPAFPAAAPP